MRVTKEAIENAVLQIFLELKIPAGGRLLFSDIRSEWPKTQLRAADMIEGVKRLTFAGHLELDDCNEGALFILTSSGYQRATKLPQDAPGLWSRFVSSALLGVTRHRSSKPQMARRRITDIQAASS